jgi:hypothetical protein
MPIERLLKQEIDPDLEVNTVQGFLAFVEPFIISRVL